MATNEGRSPVPAGGSGDYDANGYENGDMDTNLATYKPLPRSPSPLNIPAGAPADSPAPLPDSPTTTREPEHGPPDGQTLQPMEMEGSQLKVEARAGDGVYRQIALIGAAFIMAVTWTMVLFNSPTVVGWFALHPPLQTLAIVLLTYGIITLQPTNNPKTKAAGLVRHQILVFVLAFPCLLLGTFAVSYNKWLRGANHFTTWHGTIGILCMVWLLLQIFLGAGSVWNGGSLFGGGLKAKGLWKYHRVSGYILFPLMLLTINLGGAWSNWSAKYSIWIVRFVAFTIAPLVVLAGVYLRVRTFKMPIFK